MVTLNEVVIFLTKSASRITYPFDIAQSFWNKISELAQNHVFSSIDKVKNEINDNDDALSRWCKDNLPEDFFISTETEEVYEKYAELVQWAENKMKTGDLKQIGFEKFIDASKADIYFVAFASLNSALYTVVTEERSAIGAKRDIKLPDACRAFSIRCINFIEMLRELKVKF